MHEVTGKEMYKRIEERALLMEYKDITELCKASGASRGALSDLKNGRSESLSMKTMAKLADALNVSINFFTAPEPEDEQKENPSAQKSEGKIPNYDKLNAANRAIVDSMIAQLLAAQSDD